jgi:hypothetical protein
MVRKSLVLFGEAFFEKGSAVQIFLLCQQNVKVVEFDLAGRSNHHLCRFLRVFRAEERERTVCFSIS